MAGTATTLDGLAKRVFGELVKSLPEFAILQQLVPFSSKAKLGKEYEIDVVLTRSHGVSFQKTLKQTPYNLNAVRTMQTLPARTSGAEIVMRESVAYGMLAAAQQPGATAYDGALPLLMASMMETHRFYLEENGLYGQSATGAALLSSVSGASTSRAWIITQQSWATGFWSQMEGAALDAYDPTLTTKRNANAIVAVGSVDASTRTVNVTGNATDLTAIVAGDVLVPATSKSETTEGLDKIITNTGSLFGIDASAWGLWRGNTLDAQNAPCTIFTIGRAVKQAVGRGLIGKRVVALCNESTFNDIAEDAAGLRSFQDSQKAGVDQGTTKLTFNGANGNMVEIVSHPMVKQGDVFCITPKDWIRGGESDITSGLPGEGAGEKFFFDLENVAGKEMRNFSSQFWMSGKPSYQVKITNVLPRSAV